MKLIDQLFDGPIDIVGDVHGEIEALENLLARLGYDSDRLHPDGRRLVFAGDLTDRGPDSPAVLKLVKTLVETGRAQCIAGNHELNLMRDVNKDGNDWWTQPDVATKLPAVTITPDLKAEYMQFLSRLPLALERDGLRVVHACWNSDAIARVRARQAEDLDVLSLYLEGEAQLDAYWQHGPGPAELAAELAGRGIDLKDKAQVPPFLPVQARKDTEYQMNNPVSVMTSGEEAPTDKPFLAGGKWRMVERVKWWESYDDPEVVVVGHYWRRFEETLSGDDDKHGPDLFEGVEPHHWLGERANVYCVDFSVGRRPKQRAAGKSLTVGQLAALRVPEWTVVHDYADPSPIGAPGNAD